MKRGTPDHPKTHALAAALSLPRYAAVGLLESLWHFTAQYAPRGDVGRHADEALARAIHWDGEPVALLSALVAAGWLDACPCHRLRVHDWPAHADQTVQRVLTNRKLVFAECYADASIKLASCYPDGQHETSQPLPLPLAVAVSQEPIPIPEAKGGNRQPREGQHSAPVGAAPDSTRRGHGAPRPSTPTTWPTSEAIDDWRERYGAGSGNAGAIVGTLTPLVRGQAQERAGPAADAWAAAVRPAWRRYLGLGQGGGTTHPSPSAADFVAHFADWREGGRGAGGNGRAGPSQPGGILEQNRRVYERLKAREREASTCPASKP